MISDFVGHCASEQLAFVHAGDHRERMHTIREHGRQRAGSLLDVDVRKPERCRIDCRRRGGDSNDQFGRKNRTVAGALRPCHRDAGGREDACRRRARGRGCIRSDTVRVIEAHDE